MKYAAFGLAFAGFAFTSAAATAHDLGFSGLLGGVQELPPITLASGKPMAEAPYELESGKYYRLEFIADGSAEIAISGPEFFRNVWVNEVVINDIEVRPLGIDSLEFDDAGSAEIGFIAIKPGQYELGVPGARGDSQKVKISIQ